MRAIALMLAAMLLVSAVGFTEESVDPVEAVEQAEQLAEVPQEPGPASGPAQGDTLDAAALLGDACANYSYRCIVTVGESNATSETFVFPSAQLSAREDEVSLDEEQYDCENDHHDFDYENVIPVDQESHRLTCKLCGYKVMPCEDEGDHAFNYEEAPKYIDMHYHGCICTICGEAVQEDHYASCVDRNTCRDCGGACE